ncbi:MAG TPA: SPASM domain-containing protein [Candidatus Omnitrophota bacterium]|nr:SPASM domain-containing protein [Candidatus Omnitrophota bacterium]
MSTLPYLGIRYQVRYHKCNLKCPYCIVSWDKQDNLFDNTTFTNVIEKIKDLPHRISLRIGIGGEIFTSQQLMDGIRNICNTPSNIANVSFSTNLAADWEKVIGPFFSSIDTGRIGIGCTLHDTVISDIDGFFDKVKRIKELGAELYVGYVAVPGRIDRIARYKKICDDIGVPLIMNGLVGKLLGAQAADPSLEYPRDYTSNEISELKVLWDTPHSFKLLIESCRTQGMECSAGHNYVYINHNGDVFPCAHIKNSLGNILKDRIALRTEDTICPNPTCWCGNENQALRIVDRNYDRSRTLRIFHPKKEVPYEHLYDGYNPPIYNRNI